MAWCLAMRCTPRASTTVSTAGNPSGTAATASDTPSNSTRMTSALLWISDIAKMVPTTIAVMKMTAMPSMRPRRPISSSSGVGFSSVACNMRAMAPISVAMAVAVTTAWPVPCATLVPLNTMFVRSANATDWSSVVASLLTAALSPVSEASCTRSAAASTKRASAPTASPSPSTSKSPSTSSALGTRCNCPSRMTAELTAVI